MSHNGYAVIDFETTGLSPAHHHRVVEIGLVLVDAAGRIEQEFETVLNPGRDLGPTHIHGLRGADVRDAPTFEAIADELVELLAGRVVVAHNARFDMTFLNAELGRAGLQSPLGNDGALCTMKLATTYLPGSGRKLADCCAAFDIELTDAHEALADARATAHLLAAYLSIGRDAVDWWEAQSTSAAGLTWQRSTTRPRSEWCARSRSIDVNQVPMAFLDETTNLLPPLDFTPSEASYAALLDRALSDGFLSVGEADELRDLATDLRIVDSRRSTLHDEYFDALVVAAWSDGILTPSEAAEIDAVATMLDIDAPRRRGASQPPSIASVTADVTGQDRGVAALSASDVVVITGELWTDRDSVVALLLARGVTVGQGVTKKTTILVAADPGSLSGKARKAQQYGIPVMGGDDLRRMLAVA